MALPSPPVRSMANILPHTGPGQLADGPTVPVVPATGRRARLFRSTGPIQNCCSAPPASALRCALSATSVASRLAEVVITGSRSEEHTSELQSRGHLVCRLLLEKKKINRYHNNV